MSNNTNIGNKINIKQGKHLLKRIVRRNHVLHSTNKNAITINLEGKHGIGKTSMVKQVANELSMRYIHLDLAQLDVEDLVGLPIVQYELCVPNSDECIWADKQIYMHYLEKGYKATGQNRMEYSIPKWLDISDNSPVILCLDDYSRSNPQMMQATMNICLAQSYMSWKLPLGSTVVLTTNPSDDPAYQVAELDDAQKDRFLTFEVVFDKDIWAEHAEQVGIDSRSINFILLNPELVIDNNNGKNVMRNTPRAFDTFFNAIADIEDFASEIDYITTIGNGGLEKVAVDTFTLFIHNNLDKLPDCTKMFKVKDFEKVVQTATIVNGQKRNDIACVLTTRMVNYLTNYTAEWDQAKTDLLRDIMVSKALGMDNNHHLIRTIQSRNKKIGAVLIRDTVLRQYLIKNL